MASGQGFIDVSFGAAPGTNVIEQSVADSTIVTGANVEVYMMGSDSTSDHNSYEHSLLPLGGISAQCVAVSNGVGFTVRVASMLRLTGAFRFRYVWST